MWSTLGRVFFAATAIWLVAFVPSRAESQEPAAVESPSMWASVYDADVGENIDCMEIAFFEEGAPLDGNPTISAISTLVDQQVFGFIEGLSYTAVVRPTQTAGCGGINDDLLTVWHGGAPNAEDAIYFLIDEPDWSGHQHYTTGRGSSVSGWATLKGEPLAVAAVELYWQSPDCTSRGSVPDDVVVYETTTSGDGSYTLSGVVEGAYNLRVIPANPKLLPMWHGATTVPAFAKVVCASWEYGAVADDVDLFAGGAVLIEMASYIGNYQYSLFDLSGSLATSGAGFNRFEIQSVPEGTYRLLFELNERAIEWHGGGSFSTAANISVIAGQLVEVLVSPQTPVLVSGGISGTDLGTIGRGFVEVYDADFFYLTDTLAFKNGRYEIENLPPGVYHLRFFSLETYGPGIVGYFYHWYGGAPGLRPDLSVPILVQAGVPLTNVDALLTPLFDDMFGTVFTDDIAWLWLTGVTTGCSSLSYCPTEGVTRAQMASFLARLLGLALDKPNFFADVSGPHAPAIAAIADRGITIGCDISGTLFCPNEFVTREQMATFLARAFGWAPIAGDRFSDVSGPHLESINAIAEAGVTLGCTPDGTMFCPREDVTRGQMAAFLRRAVLAVS